MFYCMRFFLLCILNKLDILECSTRCNFVSLLKFFMSLELLVLFFGLGFGRRRLSSDCVTVIIGIFLLSHLKCYKAATKQVHVSCYLLQERSQSLLVRTG